MSVTKQEESRNLPPAALAQAVGEEMLARLAWVTLQPKMILTMGSETGHEAGLLQARYPAAEVVVQRVDYARLKNAAPQAESMPTLLSLPAQSVDLIFANLVLPWVADRDALLREWRRVLKPEGLLMFSSLGPDTLAALRAPLGDYLLPDCVDMHETGDALTRARFADPVMDVEFVTLTYREAAQCLLEMQASGMLAGDCSLAELTEAALPRWENGRLAMLFEVVYGHAFGPDVNVDHTADEAGTVRIPLAHLRRR
jgi:malonyl-CoA O-methyltransferase